MTYHTAVDDLESFIWVLLWAIFDLLRLKSHGQYKFSSSETNMNSILHSYSYETLSMRNDFGDRLHRNQRMGQLTPGFAVFGDLLIKWLRLAKRARDTMLDVMYTPGDVKPFYQAYYQEYLKIGVDQLESLPTSWDYINEPPQPQV